MPTRQLNWIGSGAITRKDGTEWNVLSIFRTNENAYAGAVYAFCVNCNQLNILLVCVSILCWCARAIGRSMAALVWCDAHAAINILHHSVYCALLNYKFVSMIFIYYHFKLNCIVTLSHSNWTSAPGCRGYEWKHTDAGTNNCARLDLTSSISKWSRTNIRTERRRSFSFIDVEFSYLYVRVLLESV